MKNHFFLSAIGCIFSIIFRQTNVIWTIFIAGECAIRILLENIDCNKKDLEKEGKESLKFILIFINNIIGDFNKIIKSLKLLWKPIIYYGFVVISFIVFVIKNNGIVVGAKSDHEAVLHFTQISYFTAFTCFFALPIIFYIKLIKEYLKWIKNHYILCLVLLITFTIFFHKFSYVHRYILADNRHYTFYIWSRIINRYWWIKIYLLPSFTVFCLWILFRSLKTQNILFKLLFFSSIFILIIPQALIEFRYFITPYIMWRIHLKEVSKRRLFMEILCYIMWNSITIYIFLFKTFQWKNHPDELQRFMW